MGDKLVRARSRAPLQGRSLGGSGSGLAIENARLLGGEIDAWSKTGAGSRFRLRLPTNPSDDPARRCVKRR